MFPKNITGENIIRDSPILAIFPDGYVRLTFKELQQTSLVHLVSGLDEETTDLLRVGAFFAEITGYTEWVSNTTPAISIGWDWILQSSQLGELYYKRTCEPRNNLMLVDAHQGDLGYAKTATLIEAVVDQLNWGNEVKNYINQRYA